MQPEIYPDENRHRPEADRHAHEDRRWAPADKRLLGFIQHRIRRNPGSIWHRITPETFCALTGLSEPTYRRALRKIREEHEDHGLLFRTVFKHDNGSKGSWVVLVADAQQLLFDGEPLFHDIDDKPRHVRPSLHEDEIQPTERVTAGKSQKSLSSVLKGGFTSRPQRQKPGRAGSGSARHSNRPRWRRCQPTREGDISLRRCAHGITRRRLEPLHWDNCRIDHRHLLVAGWVLKRLREGHHEDDIARAYQAALRRAHGFAVDFEADHGSFTLASTFAEASRLLSRDGLQVAERANAFYARRQREKGELVSLIAAAETSSSR